MTKAAQPKTTTVATPASRWAELMTESARFAADRLQQDIAAQQALAACKTPFDVLHLQATVCQRAFLDYNAHAIRAYGILTGTDTHFSGSRAYDDVPL